MLRLRLGLLGAATALLASLGSVAACGSLSNASFAGGGSYDAGGQPDGEADVITPDAPAGDVMQPDAPMDASAPPPPGVLFVQASPSLPDQRFCWTVGNGGQSTTDRPYPWTTPMPASNYAGVPVGGAVALADASSMLGGDLIVYAIDAQALAYADQTTGPNAPASKYSCAARIDGYQNGQKVDVTAIHKMPTITSGAIAPGSTVVLAVRGCFGTAYDPRATTARCGADWSASAGNLRMDVVQVPGASAPEPEAGVFAVQAAQLSPALAVLAGDAGAVVSFGAQGAADAGRVTTLSAPGQILPSAPLQVGTSIPLASFGQLGFAVDVGNAGGAHLWMSLAQSLDLVDPTQNPSQYFAQPTTYLVTVIGDPAGAPPGGAADAAYDGTGLHLLVLPLP